MRRRDLGLVHGDNHTKDTNGDTCNEAADDEHGDVDGGSLNGTANGGDQCTELNGPPASEAICSLTGKQGAEKGSTGED